MRHVDMMGGVFSRSKVGIVVRSWRGVCACVCVCVLLLVQPFMAQAVMCCCTVGRCSTLNPSDTGVLSKLFKGMYHLLPATSQAQLMSLASLVACFNVIDISKNELYHVCWV